jgi:hypothetical protein
VTAILSWLEATQLAQALRASAWGYAITECVHLIGIAILVGAAVALDFRLLGFARAQVTLAGAWTMLHRLAVGGAALAVWTGLLLFITDARQMAANPAFLTKVGLLTLAAANAATFHARVARALTANNTQSQAPLRLYALISLIAWLGAITCGRLIAYV